MCNLLCFNNKLVITGYGVLEFSCMCILMKFFYLDEHSTASAETTKNTWSDVWWPAFWRAIIAVWRG